MIVMSKVIFVIRDVLSNIRLKKMCVPVFLAAGLVVGVSHAQNTAQLSALDKNGYKVPNLSESEFDNQSESFIKDWRAAVPKKDYEDTDFGQLIYNEASTPTKLEVLRLLSKDTPSLMVFMTAISMGIDIENLLRASVKYAPEKGRDLAASAVNLLPVLAETEQYLYSGYELEDIERKDEDSPFVEEPYSVAKVIDIFFKDRLVLRPFPDWNEGQYHFMASAAELKRLQAPQVDVRWYRAKTTEDNVTKRPIFISLYEATSSVLIDSEARINQALKNDPNAQLPVVFIFNRLNERAVDELGYPLTIRGLQSAYIEKGLMLTPSPEWQLGEYHIYARIDEINSIFDIPEEQDFEPEAWQKLLEEAENYSVTNTSFLFVVVGAPQDDDRQDKRDRDEVETSDVAISDGQLYATWDDPRTESTYPFVAPKDSDNAPMTLKGLVEQGLIFNRPDLIAALDALGVEQVPVVLYYNDSARVHPYPKGARALIQAAVGTSVPNTTFSSGSGGILCASPPCTESPN